MWPLTTEELKIFGSISKHILCHTEKIFDEKAHFWKL